MDFFTQAEFRKQKHLIDAAVGYESYKTIGSIMTSSARGNIYSSGGWTSNGPWTTYYNTWQDDPSITQGWNMLMGDGYPNGSATTFTYVFDGENTFKRLLDFSSGPRLGHIYKNAYLDQNSSSYGGITLRAMPVRNTTNSQISRVLYRTFSSGGNGNYTGSSLMLYTPNANTYASTTGGTWSTINTSSTTGAATAASGTAVIPANTTVIIVHTSAWAYQTTSQFKDTNLFYNLDNFFQNDNSLVCDLKMLYTLETGRVMDDTQTTANPWKWYNLCAERFGNR